MNDYKTFREMLKGELLIMLLYVMSSFYILVFCYDLTEADLVMYRKKIIECFVILAVSLILIVLLYCFKKNTRKIFAQIVIVQFVLFSILLLRTLLTGYYKLYEKIGWEIILVYAMVGFILFVLCSDYHKKLPSEEELNKKKKPKVQQGVTYGASAATLGILRHLTSGQRRTVGLVISLIIICGWLAFAWIMQEFEKAYWDGE